MGVRFSVAFFCYFINMGTLRFWYSKATNTDQTPREAKNDHSLNIYPANYSFMARHPRVCPGLLIFEVSNSHSDTPHTVVSSGRVMGSWQRPLPDNVNTHKRQKTDMHVPARFETATTAGERPHPRALDRAATGIGVCSYIHRVNWLPNELWKQTTRDFCGAAAQRGLWPPHSWGFYTKHNDAQHLLELLWKLVAETSTWKHRLLTTDKHPCPRQDSNPESR